MNHHSLVHSRDEETPWKDHHVSRLDESITTIIMTIVIVLFVTPVVFYCMIRTVQYCKNRRSPVPDEEEELEMRDRHDLAGVRAPASS
ncbi:hypothetical protein AK830_g5786 [Neonectria ditissima]|uniref:Uncharacterized protein n=1 Tax=Neonectria ditissima TaxID=78410 RepID=A0A0P7BIF4_9HYPO|nr:hypothetical protein AK830_g5786 [Neonectria ditissima]